jgi:hypothetical protein
MLRSIALSLISLREAKLGWGAAALMFPHPRSSKNPPSLRGIDNFVVQRSEFYHINFLVVTNFHHAPGANKKSWLQLNPNLEIPGPDPGLRDSAIRTRTGAGMKHHHLPIMSRQGRPKLETK